MAEKVASQAQSAAPQIDEQTSLRLGQARGRIWVDLREGIDLKVLARMDTQSAREEIKTAIEEIVRFRSLDLTSNEITQIANRRGDYIKDSVAQC